MLLVSGCHAAQKLTLRFAQLDKTDSTPFCRDEAVAELESLGKKDVNPAL